MIGLNVVLGVAVSAARGTMTGQTLLGSAANVLGGKLQEQLTSTLDADATSAVRSAELWLAARPPSPARDLLDHVEPTAVPEVCSAVEALSEDLDGSNLRGVLGIAFTPLSRPRPDCADEAADLFYEALLRALITVPDLQGRAQALLTEWLLRQQTAKTIRAHLETERRSQTQREVVTNLSAPRDALVGRAEALRELRMALMDVRLVTAIGTGGTGKTRLVRELGWTRRDDWDGVWFCDLASARTTADITAAVADALEIPVRGDPIEQIGWSLRSRNKVLLILDNFEQLLELATETVGVWLDMAPETRFLVTSRARLELVGEQLVQVGPLPVQQALELFVQRAAAVRPRFKLAATDVDVATEIVQTLDCLPLAIELAAARMRALTVDKLLRRLGDRFRLLKGRNRGDRQNTLEAAIAWSWDLLTEDQQQALAQLSVFAATFTLEACEGILDLDDPDAWPLDVVEALIDHSLVAPSPDSPEDRFRLLVSVRVFASKKLADQGRVVDMEVRHEAWYLEELEACSPGYERDVEELGAVLNRASRRRQMTRVSRLLTEALDILERRWVPSQIAELFKRLQAATTDPHDRAWVELAQCRVDKAQGNLEGLEERCTELITWFEACDERLGMAIATFVRSGVRAHWGEDDAVQAFQLAEAAGNQRLIGHCALSIAGCHVMNGEPEGLAWVDRAIEALEASGTISGRARALFTRVGYHMVCADYLAAEEELARMVVENDRPSFQLTCRALQATVANMRGKWEQAFVLAQEAHRLATNCGRKLFAMESQAQLEISALELGRLAEVRKHLPSLLRELRERKMTLTLQLSLLTEGRFQLAQGNEEAAKAAFLEIAATDVGAVHESVVARDHLARMARRERDLDTAWRWSTEALAISEGSTLKVEMAIAHLGLAETAAAGGRPVAQHHIEEASTHLGGVHLEPNHPVLVRLQRLQARA